MQITVSREGYFSTKMAAAFVIIMGTSIYKDDEWVFVPCNVCNGSDHSEMFNKEGFKHVRCDNCGHVFVNPRLASHVAFQECGGTATMGDMSLTSAQRKRLTKQVKAFEKHRVNNLIVEIGPGMGWFLQTAKDLGWETIGVEVNREIATKLRNMGITQIFSGSMESVELPESQADVVRLWDVIEHLEDPKLALMKCRASMREGGCLQISTTNFASLSRIVNGPEWVYLNGADHIHLFEPKTISDLLLRTGFKDINIRTRSFNLRKKLYHPEKVIHRAPIWLRPFRKIIDELIRFTSYGHQMIVHAIRRQ